MPKAIAIVAHHDDHVLWMGGAIQRLSMSGWQWTLVAMCVPRRERLDYFVRCWSVFGAKHIAMQFQDGQAGEPFSRNNHDEMQEQLIQAVKNHEYDYVFTHSRNEHGEYGRHANHVEVCKLTTELVSSQQLGRGPQRLAYFSYRAIYGGRTATCASPDASHYLQLTYPELLWKCQLCHQAPDVNTNLSNLAFPCPNPEGFEGDNLILPDSFVCRK